MVDLVKANCPEGEELESITIEAGPMRGIEPQAMQWAWEAATQHTLQSGFARYSSSLTNMAAWPTGNSWIRWALWTQQWAAVQKHHLQWSQ